MRRAPSITTHGPAEWLAELRIRDEVLWKAANAYANSARNGLVMEGGLWPDWVANLHRPHVAIFIVDTADDAGDRLVEMTRNDPQSWIAERRWSEAKIRNGRRTTGSAARISPSVQLATVTPCSTSRAGSATYRTRQFTI